MTFFDEDDFAALRTDDQIHATVRLLLCLDCPQGVSEVFTTLVDDVLADNAWIEDAYQAGRCVCDGMLGYAIERRLLRLRAIGHELPRIMEETEDARWRPVYERLLADIERLEEVDSVWAAIARGEGGR